MELVDGCHLEFWYLDSSKYKNDARNGLSMPHLIGKVIYHTGFYDHLLLSKIFNMVAGGHLEFWWLDWSKYKNDARNGFSMPKLVGKVVLHSFWYQFVSSYISNMATGGHFGFWLLTNSAAIFARVMETKFFLDTSKSSNQVSNLTMLSVVTAPPDCTQLML